MAIPTLTKEQRITSFIETRLCSMENKKEFTKWDLAKFCLDEIDYAFDLVKSIDYKDVEEQFEDDED